MVPSKLYNVFFESVVLDSNKIINKTILPFCFLKDKDGSMLSIPLYPKVIIMFLKEINPNSFGCNGLRYKILYKNKIYYMDTDATFFILEE